MNDKVTTKMWKEKRWNRYMSGAANNDPEIAILTVKVTFGLPSPDPGKCIRHIWYIKLMKIPMMAHSG